MPLLADYAITPDVFDQTSYDTAREGEARIDVIRDAMLTDGLVRDLRDGAWRSLFRANARPWHRRGKELLKKLATQGRLVRTRSALPDPPPDDKAWCAEALAAHAARTLRGGVIVTESVKAEFAGESLVARIDRLGSARSAGWTVTESVGNSITTVTSMNLKAVSCSRETRPVMLRSTRLPR